MKPNKELLKKRKTQVLSEIKETEANLKRLQSELVTINFATDYDDETMMIA